jgi:hypothetical protein
MKQLLPGRHESTSQQQTAIEVTVYNENFGLIKDQRKVKLPKGFGALVFMDVAANIIPSSVHIHSISAPGKLSVLEQSCEYERIKPENLLDKYIGKEVKIWRRNPPNDQRELMTATLIYGGNDGTIYQIGDEIIMGRPEQIIFPKVSENIITKPNITWLLHNEHPSPQTIETVYLVRGISWKADYHIVLDQEDTKADIFAWGTIDNGSGLDYANAKLKLVAGDINRLPYETHAAEYCSSDESTPFKGESFADGHTYYMERLTTLKNGQTKQIGLLKAKSVKINKEYRLSGPALHHITGGFNVSASEDISIYLIINNKKGHGLGMPLPKGNVQVYKHGSDESLQFIGSDYIGHVPENETASVKLGAAFDIKATRIQRDFKKLSDDIYEANFEITIRNHKKEDVDVRILEQIISNWEIVKSSRKFERVDSGWVEWPVSVKSDGEATLTYRVRIEE